MRCCTRDAGTYSWFLSAMSQLCSFCGVLLWLCKRNACFIVVLVQGVSPTVLLNLLSRPNVVLNPTSGKTSSPQWLEKSLNITYVWRSATTTECSNKTILLIRPQTDKNERAHRFRESFYLAKRSVRVGTLKLFYFPGPFYDHRFCAKAISFYSYISTVLHTPDCFRTIVFRWFEELGPICELLEKANEIGASEIKSPTGRVFQKYVYTCFIVKMRINVGSFGLF